MKTAPIILLVVGTAVITAPAAFAQGGGFANPSAAPAVPAIPAVTAPATSPASQSSTTGIQMGNPGNSNAFDIGERILNSDDLGIDFQNGTMQWKNIKFDVGNNLLVRDRFVRYLSQPGTADSDEQYQHILNQIKDLLSPTSTSDDDVQKAYDLLGEAAKFEQDGGASAILMTQVKDAWQARDEMKNNQIKMDDLDTLREKQQTAISNDTTAMADKAKQDALTASPGPKATGGTPGHNPNNTLANTSGSTNSNTFLTNHGNLSTVNDAGTLSGINSLYASPDESQGMATALGSIPGQTAQGSVAATPNMAGSTYSVFDGQDLVRTMAKEMAAEGRQVTLGIQSKLEFQTQVIAFMLQRRFQHSLMAAQFYNVLFKGSEQRIDVGMAAMSKFMQLDNVMPTVNTFQFVSQEAIADTDGSMKSVDSLYDAGERWSALEQLQQSFLLGEMLPSVQAFDPAKRKVLLNIYRESNDLKNLMDLHDLDGAEELVKKIQADASDFPIVPIISAINEGKQASQLALYKAKSAMLAGNTDIADLAFADATKIWPLNPAIKNLGDQLDSKMNDKVTEAPKFDELLKEGNDREIYNQRIPFGMAFYDDPDRLDKYKEIVDRVGKVDMMVGLADNALKQNNGYLAWEMLVSAAQLEPSDPVVALAQRKASSSVAPFVSALDAADHAEKAGQYASSLNYYLQAEDIYPASKLAADGVELVGKELMSKLNPTGPSARALAAELAAKAAAPPPAQAQSMAPALTPTPAKSPAPPVSSTTPPAPGSATTPPVSSLTPAPAGASSAPASTTPGPTSPASRALF